MNNRKRNIPIQIYLSEEEHLLLREKMTTFRGKEYFGFYPAAVTLWVHL